MSKIKTQVFDVKSIEVATKVFDKAKMLSFTTVPKKFDEFTLFELNVTTSDGEQMEISLYVNGVVKLIDVLTMKPTYVESEA